MKKTPKTVVASAPTTTGNVFKDMLLLGRADTEVAHLVVELAERIAKQKLGVDAAASLIDLDPQVLATVLQGNTAGFPAGRLRELIKCFKEKTKRATKAQPPTNQGRTTIPDFDVAALRELGMPGEAGITYPSQSPKPITYHRNRGDLVRARGVTRTA